MVQLENCPCCDGPGMLKDTHGKIRQGWVGCKPCGLYIGWKISPDGAIAKWNKRAGVPDHGNLIDADALVANLKDEKGSYFGYEAAIIGEKVSSAPVIIPATRSKEA